MHGAQSGRRSRRIAGIVLDRRSTLLRSRSFMNSWYFAVPGRGGASAGKPPSHCGMYSPIPSASFSSMVPQPLRLPASNARVATTRDGGNELAFVEVEAFARQNGMLYRRRGWPDENKVKLQGGVK